MLVNSKLSLGDVLLFILLVTSDQTSVHILNLDTVNSLESW